jgi:ATP-dependent Zn protease
LLRAGRFDRQVLVDRPVKIGRVQILHVQIDCAVREIVTGAFEKATGILEQRRDWLERGAKLLLERETLVEEDLTAFRVPLSAVA